MPGWRPSSEGLISQTADCSPSADRSQASSRFSLPQTSKATPWHSDLAAIATTSHLLVAANVGTKRDSTLANQPVGSSDVRKHDGPRNYLYLARLAPAASGTDLPTPIADQRIINKLLAEPPVLAVYPSYGSNGLPFAVPFARFSVISPSRLRHLPG